MLKDLLISNLENRLKKNESFSAELFGNLEFEGLETKDRKDPRLLAGKGPTGTQASPNPKDRTFLNSLLARMKYKPEIEENFSSQNIFMIQRLLDNFSFMIFLKSQHSTLFPQLCKISFV